MAQRLPRQTINTIILLATCGYLAIFPLLYPLIGIQVAVLSAFVVLLAATAYGMRIGIVAALLLGVLVNPFLFHLQGTPLRAIALMGIPGIAAMILIAAVVGRLRDLYRRLQSELAIRQSIEIALHQTTYKYRQLFEAAGDAILIFDPDTEIIYEANPQACRYYGFPRDEMIGMSLKDLSNDVELGEAAIQQTLREGSCHDLESVHYRKDGTKLHILISATVVDYEGRQAILSINRDITARLETEAALRQSEARFQSLLHSLKDVVWSSPLNGQDLLYINNAVEEVFGHSLDFIRANPDYWLKAIHEADRERIESQLHKLFDDGHHEMEYRIVRPDGTIRWIRNSASIIYDEAGQPERLGGVTTDITEHKEIEVALRESRDRYSNVVDTVKDIVFQTDTDGCWTFLNPAWEEITGFTTRESLGRSLHDFVYAGESEQSRAFFHCLIRRKQVDCQHEIRFQTRAGGFRWLEVYARLLCDDTGRPIGISGTLHDVTEQREAMEVLENALDRERELGTLKSRFVSMASHELRTPLTAIKSSAELLQQFGEHWGAERRLTLFNRILHNVDDMIGLIDDVLLVGRADSGRLPFIPEHLELHQYCRAFVDDFRHETGIRHQIHLTLPEPPLEAEVDPKLLQLILGNLLSNAVKYSLEGSRIDLRVTASDGYVSFVVADRGIGIPEADLPRLFEAFHRASNVGNRPGTGLGLSIAHKAAALHGGIIDVTSTEGIGTSFTVQLPLVAEQSDAECESSISH